MVVRFVQLSENARSHPPVSCIFFNADHDDLFEIYIFFKVGRAILGPKSALRRPEGPCVGLEVPLSA